MGGREERKRTETPGNMLYTHKQALVCDCKSETVKLGSSLKFAQNLLHGHLFHWGRQLDGQALRRWLKLSLH